MKRISKSLSSAFSGNKIQLDPGIWTATSRIQLLYGAWVNMTHLAIGLGFGFTSVQISQLSSPDSEIPITRNDASWIASVLLLFCPVGCIISGFVTDRSGRRTMIIFCQVPMFIGWLYTSLAETPVQIIIARAITGVGCGMAMSPPRVYCTEISLPNIRAVLGSFPPMALSIGMTVQAALNIYFHWKFICCVCCIFTFASFCSFILLPETPYFILQTKSADAARENLLKFRGPTYNIDREIEQLIDFRDDNNIRLYRWAITSPCNNSTINLTLKQLSFKENLRALFSKASCKPLFLMVTYIFIGQMAGTSCVMFWSIELLTETKSSFDVHTGNILLAMTRFFMGIVTAILLYRVRRRSLALTSAIGVAVICFTIGVFLIYNDKPSVLPIICLVLYNVFASLGYYPLPNLMTFELLPLQVRGILGGALVSVQCLMMFASTKAGPFMVDSLGVDYTFLTFGGCSLVGVIFLYFYLPETKDLTLQEIEEYFKEIRPTLVSQRLIMSMGLLVKQNTPKSSSAKLNRDASYLMTSKSSTLVKLEAQKQLLKIYKEEESRTERDSIISVSLGSKSSTESKKPSYSERSRVIFNEKDDYNKDVESIKSLISTDSKKSQKYRKSEEKNDDDKDAESNKSLKLTDSKGVRIIFDEKDDNDKDVESYQDLIPTDSIKSREDEKSKKNDDGDKDAESIKSTKSTDSKKSRKDGKRKESIESSKDGEDSPKDKDQASTSKKNTQ